MKLNNALAWLLAGLLLGFILGDMVAPKARVYQLQNMVQIRDDMLRVADHVRDEKHKEILRLEARLDEFGIPHYDNETETDP